MRYAFEFGIVYAADWIVFLNVLQLNGILYKSMAHVNVSNLLSVRTTLASEMCQTLFLPAQRSKMVVWPRETKSTVLTNETSKNLSIYKDSRYIMHVSIIINLKLKYLICRHRDQEKSNHMRPNKKSL